MIKVYADNASTSFPKPEAVGQAVYDYITKIGTNIGRGSYEKSYSAGRIIYETRELLCETFNFDEPSNVVFTSNITESLNILIKGFIGEGDHVIVSSMEHNSVIRPLHTMKQLGADYTIINCSREGFLDIDMLSRSIKENTKLVLINHASNVCGSVQNIEAIGQICLQNKIHFAIDSAQSAGIIPIDFKKSNLSALPFTGHKGLMGPQGVGGLIIREDLIEKISPYREGGTGSFSEQEFQPVIMPDKFESGTLNIPNIFGLNAAVKFVREQGVRGILEHEVNMNRLFINNLLNIDGIKLYGNHKAENRTSVFSLTFNNIDSAEAAFILDTEYGIMTRSGIHCSPLAHKTLGTFPEGTVRLSFGFYTTKEDLDYVSNVLLKLAARR